MKTSLFSVCVGIAIVHSACEQRIMESLHPLTGTIDPTAISVTTTLKQPIQLGIDAERLWHWRSNIKSQLAQLAVGELEADYVRVAINCAYEREEGTINPAAYNQILELMNALKTANPQIDFFASPRPLFEAYTAAEKETTWGHVDNVPWSPYPAWIQEWDSVGTRNINGVVVPRWAKGDFHVDKLVQYYADYLNLMKTEGFDIAYLDLSNEQTIITPAYAKHIKDSLPAKLNAGVNMPLVIAPSTWSVQLGIDWLAAINTANGEQHGFDVASVHNTGAPGSLPAFVTAANSWGKDAWNTEMHGWTGLVLRDEILNSDVFWRHMQAGFTGVDTWLFFGPLGGAQHAMIWSHWNNGTIIRTGKYEIFKQVVNNANGGNYVEVSSPVEQLSTAAFVKDNILSVWVLNKDTATVANQTIEFGSRNISGKTINVSYWHESLPNAGAATDFVATNTHHFTYDIEGESLYFFKIDLQ
ncbi:hypothetical protein ACFOET_19555 [Parapedobacter deserti]|uniref:Glycosyl hydrolase-like 10 domain-containing protein n=1 Tax=Parapedobacter deserti TaxID=1912957 RepID=A0ABV7JPA0_9SPHI